MSSSRSCAAHGTTTTTSSCTTSTPTPRAKTATAPRKIKAIEQLDAFVPELRALSPDVIAVSGDHATPSQMAAHSWHPVPTILWSERCGRDDVEQYGERWCRQGALGLRPTKDLMAFMLANADRLAKYGA